MGRKSLPPIVHRRPTREPGRNFDHHPVDEHGHRIQVACPSLQAKALRFKWKRPAAGKWIVEGWKRVTVEQLGRLGVVRILSAGTPPACPDLLPRSLQDFLV